MAVTRPDLKGAYEEIATTIGIPCFDETKGNSLQLLSDWLSDESNGSWLMVLDNADDANLWTGLPDKDGSQSNPLQQSMPLIRYLPRGSHGQILLTTMDAHLGKQLANDRAKPITISPFERADAVLLLRSKISEDDEVNQSNAAQLVEALDYLPLAITQAAAYLDQTDMTVARYLQLLKDGKTDIFDLLRGNIHDISRDYEIQNSVFQTWKISFDQISNQFPRSAELLVLMAILDRHAIQADLLQPSANSDLNFIAAIQKLKAFSLIDEEVKKISVLKAASSVSVNQFSWISEETRMFSMHRLVQLSVRKWLEHRGTLHSWREAALGAVSKLCPSVDVAYWNVEDWRAWKLVSQHIHVFSSYDFQKEASQLHRASILNVTAEYLWNQVEYKALGRLVIGLTSREKTLGPDISRLFTTNAPDIICNNPEMLADASAMFQQVLVHYERLLGTLHPKYLGTVNSLGLLYFDQGKLIDAEVMAPASFELKSKYSWTRS
jgi:hypothetical protein